MELKLYDVRLRQLALMATALSCWRKEDIQSKLKLYFYPYARRGKEEFLIRIIKEVMQKVDPNSLPSILYSEVILAIKEIGYKLSNWFYYIRRRKAFRNIPRKELYDKFFSDVYFTHYGTIDELKILKSSWMKILNVDLGILYIMACYYCSEDLINELWEKLSRSQFYSYEHLCKRYGFHLVAYWDKLRANDLDSFFTDCIVPRAGGEYSIYDANQSVDVNMFRLAVRKGYVRAVKFFGSKISQEEKEKNLKFCLTLALDIYYEMDVSQFYRREQYTEICLHLSQFLTDPLKKEIFHDLKMSNSLVAPKDNIRYIGTFLNIFINMWPWQECFKFVFHSLEKLIDEKQYGLLMSSVISEMGKNHNIGIPSQSSISQRQLHQLWNSIPSDWKITVTLNLSIYSLFCWDKSSTNMIFNDKQLISKRQDVIKMFHSSYYDLVNEKNEEILHRFINEILISKEWCENIREIVRSVYSNIMLDDFDSINNVLKVSSQEETNDIKVFIDHELMCYYLIRRNKYEVADIFLNWKFDKKKDIKAYKKTFYKKNFTDSHIRYLWDTSKENVNSVKMNSDKFLLWFLETEIDIISYKIKHFVSKMFEDSTFFMWPIGHDNFEILEDFIDWCNLNEAAFKLAKRCVIKDYLIYSIRRCMRKNSIDKADRILKWAFGDSDGEEKKIFMRDALLQPAWRYASRSKFDISPCRLYLGKYWHYDILSPKPAREEVEENCKRFIDFFVKPYLNLEDLDEFKRILKAWPEISECYFEEIGEDEPSTAECYSEYPEDDEDMECFMYCEKENLKLFLSLLDSMNNKISSA